jgi:S-DNA-T family DNA segregation ATPase FtsK/SpoIIIE
MTEETDLQYCTAVGLMVLTGIGSTSYIQRKLGIGYNQAARLVEQMEADGVLAKPDHVGKREVLLKAHRVHRPRSHA